MAKKTIGQLDHERVSQCCNSQIQSLELEDDTGDLELEGDGAESRDDEEMFGVHVCAGSESGGEMDDASLGSCQKPTLRYNTTNNDELLF